MSCLEDVRVQNLDTGLIRSVQTFEDGSYTFLGLRPSRYSVYVEASGFRPARTKEIVLNLGQKAELSFRLEVSSIMEAIEVLSKTQLLEERRTSVSTTVVERLIKSLPSRMYRNLGSNQFEDSTLKVGLGHGLSLFSGFGIRFVDLDRDSWPDLVIVNGHILDNIHLYHPQVWPVL